jgi:hypothetical protein
LEASITYSQNLQDIGIVLSLRENQVWASWLDDRAPVMLGDHEATLAVMRDFIRQSELGERLMNKAPKGGHAPI